MTRHCAIPRLHEIAPLAPPLSRLSLRPDVDLLRSDRFVAALQLARVEERQDLHRAARPGGALVYSQGRARSRHARPATDAAPLFYARDRDWSHHDDNHRNRDGLSIQ